jgi:hypothetical protein
VELEKTNVERNLRWSLHSASREFQMDRETIARRLSEANQEVGSDGLYSSMQLLAAFMGGDIRQEKLRETRARALRLELQNAKEQNRSLNAEEVYQGLERLFVTLKQEVLGSALSPDAQRSLLSHLAEYKAPGK